VAKRSRTKRQRRQAIRRAAEEGNVRLGRAAISNSPRASSSSGKSPGSVQGSRSSGGGSGGNQSQKKESCWRQERKEVELVPQQATFSCFS
jgi:hypothetical protein